MGKGLKPDLLISHLDSLSVEFLKGQGLKGIIVDLDNTIISWRGKTISEGIIKWFAIQQQAGIKFCIVSNNLSKRVTKLSRELGVPAISRAIKPRRKAFKRALLLLGTSPAETAVVGDQIFTDVFGGNRMGLYTILVNPLEQKEFVWTSFARKFERFVMHRIK